MSDLLPLLLLAAGPEAGSSGAILPPDASVTAGAVDPLFYFILGLSALFFTLVVGTMLVFVVKYRRRAGETRRTSGISGSHKLEILWSVIPAILLVIIFGWGFWGYLQQQVPPGDALEVRVTAKRWNWEFDYPRAGILGSDELVVPEGKAVKMIMSSLDVIHSFYIPAFRIKRDVLPNRYTVTWFQATRLGTYDILCAEYCGTDHSRMIARVKVVTPAEYEAWVASGGPLGRIEDPIELGRALFRMRGCAQCHSVDGSATGKAPSLKGVAGRMEQLVGGDQVLADDEYLRESIMSPQAKLVQGWEGAYMPTFRGRLDDRQLNALIDYIKSIGQ